MVQIDDYLSSLGESLKQIPLDKVKRVIQILHHARLSGKQVFIMGNGGSASTSSHFVCDLAKNNYFEELPPFRAIDLNSSNAIFTALANDDGYENVFSHQLRNLVQPNDVVLAISTSGNSPNVLKAIEYANNAGAITIGFTGYEGGALAKMIDVEVRIPSNNIQHIEDLHMVIAHLITFALIEMSREAIALQVKTNQSITRSSKQRSRLPVTGELPNLDTLQKVLSDAVNSKGKHKTSLLFQLLNILLDLTKTNSGTLILLDEDGNVIDGAQMYGGKALEPTQNQLTEISQHGLAGWVVKNQQAALIENTNNDQRWLQRPWDGKPTSSRSAISVPIKSGKVIGCITLVRPQENQFSIKDLEIVSNMASSLAPAIIASNNSQSE
ncbi:MAG: hypothetical protein CL609_20390 [Anaerolineaceae bacterium]|nr:hypothetical protein [Anaerolineaceae bacterium]